ncbi:MAG: TrkH family potassium uptake protein, partial [Candidatus Woesearchaeota archaeon]
MKNTLLYFLGYVLTLIGISLFIPSIVSFYFNEPYTNLFITLGIIVSIVGLVLKHFFKKSDKASFKIIILTVVFGWILITTIGSLPYLMSGVVQNPADAFFESMSGFTTTGATILTDIEAVPYSVLFWRSLTHWIGGMGIILLIITILPSFGVQGAQLFQAEVSGGSINKKISPRIRKTAVLLWATYITITLVEIALLMFGGLSLYDAAIHSFGTVATGGFSSKNASIGFYGSPYVQYVIIVFMFLSGLNFILYCRFILGDRTALFKNTEARFYTLIILIFTGIITFDLWGKAYHTLEQAFRASLFQVTSIITTTGYITADFDKWSSLAKMLLFIAMFIGGCAGSTGSSIKVIRVYITLKTVFIELLRVVHPSAFKNVYIDGEMVNHKVIRNIVRFVVLYLVVFAIGSVVMSSFGLDMVSSMSAAAATLGNVGPGLGLVGAVETYAFLPAAAKVILSLLMLIGRL